MFFPEFLFQLSKRDQQVTWLDPDIVVETGSGLAAEIVVTHEIPDDRALILQSVQSWCQPGAAQNATNISVGIRAQDSTVIRWLKRNLTAGAANAGIVIDWTGSIVVPPRWQVLSLADFNAGAASNSVELSIVGLLIPVGNLQRV